MSLESLSDYWQMFFVAPLGFLLHKFVSHSGRIATLEANQKIYMKKADEQCKTNEELTKKVHEMIGRLDMHLGGEKKLE